MESKKNSTKLGIKKVPGREKKTTFLAEPACRYEFPLGGDSSARVDSR